MRIRVIRVAVLLVIAIAAANVLAQDPAGRSLIKFNLIVTDKNDRALDDIRQEEITVTERGKPQSITSFSRNVDPVDYCLAIDGSGSFRTILPAALDVAKSIINSNRPTDKTCLLRFVSSDKIEMIDELTSDKSKLVNDLFRIKPEGGQSAVVDAVYAAAKHLVEHSTDPARRRSVVLISDGEDRASFYTQKSLFQFLAEHDVQVFVIGIVSLLDNEALISRTNSRTRAEEFLKRLSKETGGRVFFAKGAKAMADAGEQIVHDLQMQYTIAYVPIDNDGKQGFREFTVGCKLDERRQAHCNHETRIFHFDINEVILDSKLEQS